MIVSTETIERVISVTPELAHRPPALTNPATITLGATTTCPTLDPTKDYIVRLPADTPYTRNSSERALVLNGGRNIILVGGEIRTAAQRAIYIVGNRGTVYLEGVKITGPGTQDVICIDSRYGGTITIQNLYVENTVGPQDGWHADVIQTWAGPARLNVDHLYAKTTYQGFFLYPAQQWAGWTGTDVDLRHVHLDVTDGRYGIYGEGTFPIACHDVWVQTQEPARPDERDWRLWPKADPRWADVRLGAPPVPMVDQGTVGVGYRSVWAELAALGV